MSEAENNYWIHQCQCTSCEEYRAKNQSKWDAAVIKAFIERVEKRVKNSGLAISIALAAEVAALEKEANERTA